MLGGFQAVLTLASAAVAAGIAGLQLHPMLAFVGGAMLAVLVIRLQRLTSEPSPAADSVRAAEPAEIPSAFGRELVEKLPTPLLIVARSGRVVYANPAASEILPRFVADAHYANVLRAPAFVEAVGATLKDGAECRVRFSANPGRERIFEARVALLPAGGAFGPEAMAIVQLEDLTETRRAEALRSDFVANASHELRTPLAAIVGYIETLQHHARDDAEARERFLGIMAREAGRMQRLVDDLMSLSRIEMTEHLRPVENLSLYQVASESVAALIPVARQQGVELAIDLPGDGPRVVGDRDQLAQVFTNLIDNAMKYGGAGTAVRVRAAEPSRAHPNRVGVTVEDQGPGIAREHLHRLTERFYRVNAAASRNKGGTGLGLAIAKHILNRHQGRLEIASTLGQGSAFTVWLPRAEPVSEAPAEIPVEAIAAGNRRSA